MTTFLLATSNELSPLVPHPIQIAVILLLLSTNVAALVVATVQVARGRIAIWPTFILALVLALLVPVIGGVIALVLALSRRVVAVEPHPTHPGQGV